MNALDDMLITAMPEEENSARKLSTLTHIDYAPINVDEFPDHEWKVRATDARTTTFLFCSLFHPNEKLIRLFLAAAALRDLGARKIVLIAPYLCYMRQDISFRSGEAVSQKVISKLVSTWFDQIVTIEPHLHRVKDLSDVFPEIDAVSISSAPLLAALIAADAIPEHSIVVGPDAESEPWTAAVAEFSELPHLVLSKTRSGDREVTIRIPDNLSLGGAHVYLVDDIVSSGATLAAAARSLIARGAGTVEALATHALCSPEDLSRIRAAGVLRVRSTDTIPHVTNAIETAPILADEILRECGP